MPFQTQCRHVLTKKKYESGAHRTGAHCTLEIKKSVSAYLEIYFIVKIVLN